MAGGDPFVGPISVGTLLDQTLANAESGLPVRNRFGDVSVPRATVIGAVTG
jgi:hypothetical protein